MQDTQPEHTGQGSTMHGDTMKHLSPRSRDHCDMTIDNRLGLYYLRYNTGRSGHIDVACRSICDWDQNGIKQSMFFLGANQGIKTNSEWLISTRSTHFLTYLAGVAAFCPLNSRKIKQEPRNGAIKQSRTIFLDEDSWFRSQTLLCVCDYSMYIWVIPR